MCLTACSGDDDDDRSSDTNAASDHPLVVVTERESPEAAFHYLYVVSDWPNTGELDDEAAFELGAPGVSRVQGGAFYFYRGPEGQIEKFSIDKDLNIEAGDKISFASRGIMGYDPEPIWVSDDLAFMVDEKSGQVARFSPSEMKIEDVDKVDPNVLERDGLKVQFQLGVAAAGRLFTTVSWRDWATNTVHQGTVLGVFDQDSPADGPQLVEDERCAASVAVGAFVDDGYIYAVGDGAQGYDMVANPNRSTAPQCVVRMKQDGESFEEDYFIDLQEVTGSPAIYMVFPMSDHKLLLNQWSPEVDIEDYADDEEGPGWYWELPPFYEHAIVDLRDKTVTKVDLPRGGAHSPKLLRVDGENYVQVFREDRGSSLYRVETDGTATKVLDNPSGTNVQYIGRL